MYGNAYYSEGDYQNAILDYNQAISINHNFAVAYNNIGNSRAAQGDKQGAIADLQKAASFFQQQNNQALYKKVMDNIKI